MKQDTTEVTEKILAKYFHEHNPTKTEAEWLKHVQTTKHDPHKFFMGNQSAIDEYNLFITTFDKNKKDKVRHKNILR